MRDALLDLRQFMTFYRLTVTEVRHELDDILTVVCSSNKPVRFKAGQYGTWFMGRWVWGKPGRLFTVASPPEDGQLQFSTRIGRTDFKKKLKQISVGDRMYMSGPIGQFVLPQDLPIDIIFVAGGIGITPIRALAKHIHNKTLPTNTRLIYSSNGSYLYEQELEQYVDSMKLVRRENFDEALQLTARQKPSASYYISGPPAFVNAARTQLRKQGVADIRTDAFLGY